MQRKVLPPPVYMIISLLGVVLSGYVWPTMEIVPYPITLFGILFIVAGAIFMGWAGILFLKYRTTLDPNKKSNKLVVEGPYKLTRNPMYLGAFLVFFGISLLSGSIVSILFSFLAPILMSYMIIPREEEMMKKTFGKQYEKYRQSVRKWI